MTNLVPTNTTIVTGGKPFLAICECDEQRYDDELYAEAGYGERSGRDLVIMERDGNVTNRYADGVSGVTDKDQQTAAQDDEPYCPACESYVSGWLQLSVQ